MAASLSQWMAPFDTETLIPYWKLKTIDAFCILRTEHQQHHTYIVSIPDEDKWVDKLFRLLDAAGDKVADIYPETVRIRDVRGHYVNTWLYRCQMAESESE